MANEATTYRLLGIGMQAAMNAMATQAAIEIDALTAAQDDARRQLENLVNKGLSASIREVSDAALAVGCSAVPTFMAREKAKPKRRRTKR